MRITSRTLLELSYRYSHFGEVETSDGAIDVVRGVRTLRVENVAGTRAVEQPRRLCFGLRGVLKLITEGA